MKELKFIREKVKEAIIGSEIEDMGELEKASVQYFLETGKVNGSFMIRLKNMMETFNNWRPEKVGETTGENEGWVKTLEVLSETLGTVNFSSHKQMREAIEGALSVVDKELEKIPKPQSGEAWEKEFRKFLRWLGNQEEYLWNGKTWDEDTGHDDFERLSMNDIYDLWKSLPKLPQNTKLK